MKAEVNDVLRVYDTACNATISVEIRTNSEKIWIKQGRINGFRLSKVEAARPIFFINFKKFHGS